VNRTRYFDRYYYSALSDRQYETVDSIVVCSHYIQTSTAPRLRIVLPSAEFKTCTVVIAIYIAIPFEGSTRIYIYIYNYITSDVHTTHRHKLQNEIYINTESYALSCTWFLFFFLFYNPCVYWMKTSA